MKNEHKEGKSVAFLQHGIITQRTS